MLIITSLMIILLPMVAHAKPVAVGEDDQMMASTASTTPTTVRQELLKRSPSNMDYFRNILETSPDIERTVLFPKEKVTPELIKMLRDSPELAFSANFTIAEVKDKLKEKHQS